MSRWAFWKDADFDALPVGGKARALALLCRAGFDIPPWRVVLPESENPEPDCGGEEFLRATGGPWAVRSSALDEDGRTHSFAGQLESHLTVPREHLTEKIRAVRASGLSDRIVLYRQQAGLPLPPPVPAVIIQQMIAAETAGVAFSADPVSGRRGIAVVAAVRGLGETLVSGDRTGDSFQVDRSGAVVGRTGSETTLSDAEVSSIAVLARAAGRFFGCPQDIEWALAGGRLFLLQSRPITSLAGQADPDGAWQLWDNSNIAESYSGVTTPLTFSFAREIYEEVYRQFVTILRVPKRRIEAGRDVFARMLGLVRGRVYYNLLSWYRVLAMLPGFAVNRQFMEQMMGVKEPLPDHALDAVLDPPRKATLRDWAEITKTLTGLVASHIRLPETTRAFTRRLDEALDLRGTPLEDLRPDELAAAYRRLQNDLLTRWDAPLINDFFAMIYFGVSRKMVRAWCGDADGTLQNDLITCQGGIISAEPARRLLHLAALAREAPELRTLLETGTPGEINAALPRYPVFAEAYHAYLEKFGDRCLEELKLESATLHDDPLLLLRSIARLAAAPAPPRAQPAGQPAETRAAAALAGHPLRKAVFAFVIQRTRNRVRDRENLRFERTRVFGRVRRIFVELGKRFHALGVLEDPRDIFFLETEEALGFVEGAAVTTRLGALARLRREEFGAFPHDPPDDRFETRGIVALGHSYRQNEPAAPESAGGAERKGIGCCPGVVRGRARVILDPRNAEIAPGEILVAPRTDPGWILLFPAAAGLLVEHGSLLSHSAIVAREMGLPAVVSLSGLTAWLRTGDQVELDGTTGRVTLLERKDLHAE